jgi:pimeloyl-ACP methyl ester carboxylesterase
MGVVWIGAGVLVGMVALSYLMEALRSAPKAPEQLPWAPDIPIRHAAVDGVRLRYIMTGDGPPLLLLHTLRTQLDMFQKVVPLLARSFRVYALDLPGHGHSDIPPADLSPELFVRAVAGFLDRLELEGVTVAGESIGGTIGLLLAARGHPRVSKVIAINPYDYDRGRGLRRANLVANVILGSSNVPVLGATVTRMRSAPVERLVFLGGVNRKESFPPALLREMSGVGNRPGYMRGFGSLVRHWPEWEEARKEYGAISRPVLLLYGEQDWSRSNEREANRRAIPGARFRVVKDAGHFLSLDAPNELVEAVREFGVTPP